MNIREMLGVVGPLLWEGIKIYAPQVKIPSDLLKLVVSNIGKAKKHTKKVRKRIEQIDDMIEKMEDQVAKLRREREEWVLRWGDLAEFLDAVKLYKEKQINGKRYYDGRY